MAHAMSQTHPHPDQDSDGLATGSPIPDSAAFDDGIDAFNDQTQCDVPEAMEDRSPTAVDIAIPDHGNPEEERTHPRVHIEVDVTARSDDTFWVGVTENISEGGLFVATSCPWPEETICQLTLALDDGGPAVSVNGRVTWIREDRGDGLTPGMGVSFVELAPPIRARVQAYVTEHIARTVLWE